MAMATSQLMSMVVVIMGNLVVPAVVVMMLAIVMPIVVATDVGHGDGLGGSHQYWTWWWP